MRERPIIFSTPMVQAILAGNKTVTRRIKFNCEIGDRLWVRESYCPQMNIFGMAFEDRTPFYRADKLPLPVGHKWKPSIHMPRWACRIFLEVASVREERLQEITGEDAAKEGIRYVEGSYEMEWFTPAERESRRLKDFRTLWDSLNAKRGYPWDSNPLVKRIEFKVVQL